MRKIRKTLSREEELTALLSITSVAKYDADFSAGFDPRQEGPSAQLELLAEDLKPQNIDALMDEVISTLTLLIYGFYFSPVRIPSSAGSAVGSFTLLPLGKFRTASVQLMREDRCVHEIAVTHAEIEQALYDLDKYGVTAEVPFPGHAETIEVELYAALCGEVDISTLDPGGIPDMPASVDAGDLNNPVMLKRLLEYQRRTQALHVTRIVLKEVISKALKTQAIFHQGPPCPGPFEGEACEQGRQTWPVLYPGRGRRKKFARVLCPDCEVQREKHLARHYTAKSRAEKKTPS